MATGQVYYPAVQKHKAGRGMSVPAAKNAAFKNHPLHSKNRLYGTVLVDLIQNIKTRKHL